MSNRWLRFGIALLAITAAAAAGYRVFQQEQHLAADLAAVRSADAAGETAVVTISELKAAMHAYVAEGQGDAFWTARAATLIDRLRASILELDSAATAAGATLTETLDSTDRLAAAEQRARQYVREGQRLMAGEVIFTDARDLLEGMRLQIATARGAIDTASSARVAGIRRAQAQLGLAALGILAFATVLLVLPGNAPPGWAPALPASDQKRTLDDLELNARVARAPAAGPTAPAAPASSTGRVAAPSAPGSGVRHTPQPHKASAVTPAGSATPEVAPTETVSAVSLREAASVCTDLGRVSQSIEISGLLARAARVLNASGVVVWVAAPDRSAMYPAASAGYDERLLARIGAIPRDAANVTAAAFRDASSRTSPVQGTAAASLAVPLMTPLGPVGVLSAEINDVANVDETRLAIATIFAAQLATLLGSMASESVLTDAEAARAAKAQA
jgi:hypothetical protein